MAKIMLDIDNVISSTGRATSKWVKKLYDIGPGDVPYKETSYNIEDAWKEMNFKKIKALFETREFWETIKPFSMVPQFVNQLRKWSEVHILTDRRWYPELEEQTKSWLYNNKIKYDVLKIMKGKEKYIYCKDNNIDLAIEDQSNNAETIANVCPVILMRWNYNESYNRDNVITVNNYFEAISETSKLLGTTGSWDYPQSSERLCDQ